MTKQRWLPCKLEDAETVRVLEGCTRALSECTGLPPTEPQKKNPAKQRITPFHDNVARMLRAADWPAAAPATAEAHASEFPWLPGMFDMSKGRRYPPPWDELADALCSSTKFEAWVADKASRWQRWTWARVEEVNPVTDKIERVQRWVCDPPLKDVAARVARCLSKIILAKPGTYRQRAEDDSKGRSWLEIAMFENNKMPGREAKEMTNRTKRAPDKDPKTGEPKPRRPAMKTESEFPNGVREPATNPNDGPDVLVEDNELWQAIDKLDADEKQVITLRLHDWTWDEIAHEMDISVYRAKQFAHSAIQKLGPFLS